MLEALTLIHQVFFCGSLLWLGLLMLAAILALLRLGRTFSRGKEPADRELSSKIDTMVTGLLIYVALVVLSLVPACAAQNLGLLDGPAGTNVVQTINKGE